LDELALKMDQMENIDPTSGVLAIMMGAGTIVDFELYELNGEIFIRIWPAEDGDVLYLRKHVAALLPSYVEERHVMLVA
jgi:hypothetical protein